MLVGYENKGMNDQVITLALKEAVEENAVGRMYVRKILDRWLTNKVLTVEEVMRDKAVFEACKKAAKGIQNKSKDKRDKFNNFEQRNYDFNSLEKKLLGWDSANEG